MLKVHCNEAKHGVGFLTGRFTVLSEFQFTANNDSKIRLLIYDLEGLSLHIIIVVALPVSNAHYFVLIHVEWHLPILRPLDYFIKIVLYDISRI